MVRTQVQLTTNQAAQLKHLAARSGRSMADLVRESLDRLLGEQPDESRSDRMHRATRVFGAFSSQTNDLSTRHDEYFADAAAARR